MDLYRAQQLALSLLREHGLAGWRFAFDRAKRRFGACHHTRRLISLSKCLTLLNAQEQVRDTLLHEIAHALTPGDGHGRAWKAACVRLGARPRRCYGSAEVVAPPLAAARFRMGCRGCGWWVERRRRSRSRLVCRRCRAPVAWLEGAADLGAKGGCATPAAGATARVFESRV